MDASGIRRRDSASGNTLTQHGDQRFHAGERSLPVERHHRASAGLLGCGLLHGPLPRLGRLVIGAVLHDHQDVRLVLEER